MSTDETREQELDDAFQARDWETVARLQDEIAADPIPRYAQLDVWMALFGTDRSDEYETFREQHGFAETWARLMGGVRERVSYANLAALPSAPADMTALIAELREWPLSDYGPDETLDMHARAAATLESLSQGIGDWEYALMENGEVADEESSWTEPTERDDFVPPLLDSEIIVRRRPAGPWLPVEGEA